MRLNYSIFMAGMVTTLLVGCGGNGSSAPAPNNVNVVAGDTSVTVAWDMQSGVEYWIYKAAGTNVTPQNCSLMPECRTTMGVSSPAVIPGSTYATLYPLTNGTQYSFSINGRVGGPGGPGSPAVQATPRLAGANWSLGAPLNVNDIHGVTYGTVFVAAGANGTLLSSIDGITWKSLTIPASVAGTNFNAATYYNGTYLVVGAGGVILRSTDAITWTQQTSNTSNDLYAVSNWGVAGFVATGANGTIVTGDGITWTPRTSNTSNALYGITYGYNKYVAAGAAGTLLTSTDGVNWGISYTPSTPSDLKGVAYGLPVLAYGYVSINATIGTFVAVGANGALVTSTDGGVTWNTSTTPTLSTLLNAVTYGHQFIAVDNVGGIFTSTNGLTWQQATSPVQTPLYAISPVLFSNASGLYIGQYAGLVGQYAYLAVGAGGNGMVSF